MRSLQEYRRKRNFQATPEPAEHSQNPEGRHRKEKDESRREEDGKGARRAPAPRFVVQRHAARRLHFDFRLEVNGALASWAVPKGPPEERGEKRLAIHVEDHPLSYAKFEGEIPKGNYGAGEVQIWDEGTFELEGDEPAAAQIERGDLKFTLMGHRLQGRFALVQMKKSAGGKEWLMIRKKDPEPAASISPNGQEKSAASEPHVRNSKITEPSQLKGAIQSPMPSHVPVALATLSDKPFSSPDWLFEIKWDGERALARIVDGEVEFWSRSGRNITAEYPELRGFPKRLNARKAIIDGEIVVLDEAGRSDFSRIQQRFGVSNPSAALQAKAPVTFYAFDLIFCDGFDVRSAALEGRKELLRTLLSPSERIRYSDYQAEKGTELYDVAKQQGLEGIIAKRLGSLYPGKRSPLWLKIKLLQDMDVVVGGWTAPRRSRDYFGALLMGLYDGDDLIYIGSIGTGFDREMLATIYKAMQKPETKECPFKVEPKVPEKAHWVKPELVARVKYHHWTNDKKLRQPVFLGLQEDRSPRDCTFQSQATPPKADAPVTDAASESVASRKAAKVAPPKTAQRANAKIVKRVASNGDDPGGNGASGGGGQKITTEKNLERVLAEGREETLAVELEGKALKLTHLNKIYFPEPELRKRDVLLHYLHVAPYILPFLKDRPLVLKRYPNGINSKYFFQKEAPASHPDWIRTAPIESKERGGKMPYFLADDTADLLYLTNLGCIDHNPWSSRVGRELHPDYIFFDLDPTDGTKFDVVLTVARAVEKQLNELGMRFYMKTSGATGFHIYLPLEPKYTYEQVRLFVGAIGQRVQSELPRLVTPERTVSKRKKGTVLIDALQNARGKPLVAVYSLRPFIYAPVSTPVSSRELAAGFQPEEFNIHTIMPRLKRRGGLWADFWKHRQTLEAAVKRAR